MNFNKLRTGFLLLFLLPILLFSGCTTGSDPDFVMAKKLLEQDAQKYVDVPATGKLVDGVRVIEIKANQFFFEPELIVVNKGEKIKLIINAEDVPHGFEIEGLDIPNYSIETVIRPGMPIEIIFDANEEGVWEFICSLYCGYGHSTMKGVFVVR